MERLSDARRNGHPVLAVVRGSRGQPGRRVQRPDRARTAPPSSGSSAQALANAGLTAADVDAVEAHGTGTTLGDPIEAQALLATYGQDRADGRPLWLGSVKSNIGHTQAAAGVAGVIKMVHGACGTACCRRPCTSTSRRPHVDWSAGAVAAADRGPPPGRETGRPRRAGRVVVRHQRHQRARHPRAGPAGRRRRRRTADAAPRAGACRGWCRPRRGRPARAGRAAATDVAAAADLGPPDVGFSLATTRSALEHRAVVARRDRAELLAGCARWRPVSRRRAVRGRPGDGRSAFLFTGQGPAARHGPGAVRRVPGVRGGAGRGAARTWTVLDRPLREVMFGEDAEAAGPDGVHAAGAVRGRGGAVPAAGVVGCARRTSWLGHSIGELAAAHVAGVLSLADACALVAARGRLMQALPAGGAMVAVEATEDEVVPLLSERVSHRGGQRPGVGGGLR